MHQHMSPISAGTRLALIFVLVLAFALVQVSMVGAAGPWYVSTSGNDVNDCLTPATACLTIQAAIGKASAGDTINVLAGTYTPSSLVDLNKPNLTLNGAGAATTFIKVSGTGDRFDLSADGVTLQGFDIEKTDKTGEQNIIRVRASNATIKDNTIHGQFVIGDGEVSRAMVFNAGAFSGINVESNTIYALRQPAYISGTHTGTIQNNYVYGTKGWVLEGGNLTFTGNTWGTGANVNVYDIAILGLCPVGPYPDIVAMSNANNGAVIEDQRVSPAVLSVVYVDGATSYTTDLGGRYHPYATIAPAITRVVAGGTIKVLPGAYNESPTLNKSLTLKSTGGRDVTTINLQTVPNYTGSMLISGQTVTVDGFTINGYDAVGSGLASTNVYVKYPATNVLLTNNRFKIGQIGSGTTGDDGFGVITEYNPSNAIASLIVTDNIFMPLNTQGQRAFYINPDVNQFTFKGNEITGNFVGRAISEARDSLIENNTITGVGAAGSRSAGIGVWGGQNVSLYGKATFRGNTISGVATGISILSAENVTVEQNTISQVGVGVKVQESGATFDPSLIEIHKNKFNSADTFAVENATATIVDAENNYWGAVSGPGPVGPGTGASVSTNVDYQPWCNADFSRCSYYPMGTISMQTSGTPAEVGDIVTMDSLVTVDGVYGMQLRVSFDATQLEFQAAGSLHNDVSAAGWFWDTVPENFVAVDGGRRLSGSMSAHPNPATLTGQSVATWKFKCLKAGTWNLTYDQTPKFGTYLATKDGFTIPANLVGGSVKCLAATASVDGYITLQGRQPTNPVPEAWQGADVKLTCVDTVGVGCNGFGPYTMTTDASGHYQHLKTATPGSGVVLGTYSATVARRAYLGAAKTTNVVIVSGSNTINTLATAPRLLGGDVLSPAGITITDLSAIGGAFGSTVTPADSGNDVNGDGVVNIFDLVLAGGNFDKASPQPW